MPPLETLLSEQASFAKHLFIQGYPLWNPDPVLLPQDLQRVGLRIGDVGTVDERGRFDLFFNILESSESPRSADAPPPFPAINENDARCGSEDILPREVVSSPETSWDVEQLEVEAINDVTRKTTQYGATLSNDGTHIILPQGAHFFELGLQHRRLLENYARENGTDWLKRFQDRLGWPRSNSIHLLTGFYKTCSWSIASFGMRTAANTDPVGVHCILMEADERLVRDDSVWQPAGRFRRKIAPAPDRQGQVNQSIFIRGIVITPNLSEPKQAESQTGLLDIFSAPARFLGTLAGGLSKTTATETPKGDVTIQHVPKTSQVSHPSEIINQYLFKKAPSARIAVTHDSQWIELLKTLEDGKSWMLGDLEDHLETLIEEHYDIVAHDGTVYLREKEHGPLTCFVPDRSHLSGGSSSDIIVESDKRPHAHGFSAIGHYIVETGVYSDPLEVAEGSQSQSANLPSTSLLNQDVRVDEQVSSVLPLVPRSPTSSHDTVPDATRVINLPHTTHQKPHYPQASFSGGHPSFNESWSVEDMLAFTSEIVNETVIGCKWVNNGKLCNDRLKYKDVRVHLHHKHGVTSDSQSYQCHWYACASSPMKRSSLERHVKEQHFTITKWACPCCTQTFTREPSLREHVRRAHGYA